MQSLRVAGAVALIVSSMALFGCIKAGPTAEQTCSAPETYANLTDIISTTLIGKLRLPDGERADVIEQLRVALSPQQLSPLLTFSTPTLNTYNKDNKKVSCNALLSVEESKAAIALIERSSDLNNFDLDHVVYRIAYTVQPAADGGDKMVYSLSKVSGLDEAIGTILLAGIASRQQAAQATAPPVADDTADPAVASADPDPVDVTVEDQPVAAAVIEGAAPGMKYDEVRKRILASGYSTAPRAADDYCGSSPQCDAFPEAESCAGTREGNCKYRFSKDGAMLDVYAKGEPEEGDPGGQTVYSISTAMSR